MQGKAFTQKLLEFKTPVGAVGEHISFFVELFKNIWLLLRLAGRDSIFLALSLALAVLKIRLALWIGQMWPLLAFVLDQGLDFGGALFTMICLSNVMFLVQSVQNRLKEIFFPRFLERVQLAGVEACLAKDTAFWDTGSPAEQVTFIFQQSERVKSLLANIEIVISCLLTLAGAVVHVWGRSPGFTLLALAFAASTGAYLMWLNRILALTAGNMDQMMASLKGGCVESLMNIRTVQAFSCELLEVSRFQGRKAGWWSCKRLFRVTDAVRRGSELVIHDARALSINYGGFLLVSAGAMKSADVLLIQALLAELLVSSFDALVGVLRMLSIDLIFTQMYLGILNMPVKIHRDVGRVPDGAAKGSLALRSVDFAYPMRPDELVLRGVSFEVPAGSFTALVGSSGSGKTTVGRLLERFYDVQAGAVLLDGIALQELRPRWLRRQIGYVEQEPRLFRGTIRDNIAYGDPSAGSAEVEEAARSAHVLSFATQLPDGLDTDVASGGQALSGGQKQRVAIARAMIRRPVIILMDEATSALDTETERSVQEALERLMSGRTTLVIAHRLTTVQKADQVVVMGGGRVLEAGPFAELAERPGGAFAALMQHQQQPLQPPPQEASGGVSPGGCGPAATEVAAEESATGSVVAAATGATGGTAGGGAAAAEGAPIATGAAAGGAAADAAALAPAAESDSSPRLRGQLPAEQQPLLGEAAREGEGEHKPEQREQEASQRERETAVAELTRSVAQHKRSLDRTLLSVPTSDRLLPQLLWMYQLMGWRKWLLLACLCFSIAEARMKLKAGPAFAHASSLLDSPAEYPAAFQSYFLINVAAILCSFMKERLRDFYEPQLAETLQFRCFYRLLQQDVDYFEKNDPASIMPRIFDQADFSAMCTTMATEGFLHGVAALLLNIYEVYMMSPPVIYCILGTTVPILTAVWGLTLAQVRLTTDVDKAHSDLGAVLVESLSNVRTMHAFGGEDMELVKFRRQRQVWWRAELRRRPWAIASDLVASFCQINMFFVVMVVIVRQGVGKTSSTLAALMYMIKVFWEDVLAFTFTLNCLGNSKAAFSFLAETLSERSSVEADVGDVPGERAAGAVELRDVHFSYSSRPGQDVLRGVSFSVPAGSFTAIVGHTGSGKTTLGRLLLRFHDAQRGAVLLDGRPVSGLQPQWLRRQIGYVEQEPRLFDETLWNNIRYGRIDASPEEILTAAAVANILPFISSLPLGFLTNVGMLGQNLSGGQKQRVAIARALLVNPAVLLLDEATSALDSQTEHELQEALGRLMAGRTSIAIAHRLSTVARADQVVVLDGGRALEVGTHQELQARGGHYARLLRTLAAPEAAGGAEAADGGAAAADGGAEGAGAAEDGLRRRR